MSLSTGPHAATVATTLLRRSAEQGNVMSLMQLGDCYYYGAGVEQDWVRAAAIYYEAYKERSSEAMFNLGFMHEYGAGVPKDLDLAQRFYKMAKHTNADAALPVYLATAWLRAHRTWEWLRPRVPKSVVGVGNWLFELRPVAGLTGGAGVRSGSVDSNKGIPSGKQPAQHAVGDSPGGEDKSNLALPASDSLTPAAAADAAMSDVEITHLEDDAGSEGHWLWWLSPQVLFWKLDGLIWRLAEATGIGGSSISTLLEEYADTGETILLIVLFAVLVLVLRIRSQRQQAVENRIRMALARPGEEQQLAAQLAAQMGLQIPAAVGAPRIAVPAPADPSEQHTAGAGSSAVHHVQGGRPDSAVNGGTEADSGVNSG